MKNIVETQQKLLVLKGETLGMECLLNAMLREMPLAQLGAVMRHFEREAEAAQVAAMNSGTTSDHVLAGLDAYVQRSSSRVLNFPIPGPTRNTAPWWRDPQDPNPTR